MIDDHIKDDHIKMALGEEMKRLATMFVEEDQLKRKINDLQIPMFKQIMKIHGLIELCDDLPSNAKAVKLVRRFQRQGLTSAVRSVLAGTGEWMSATQVRDLLVRLRIDLTKYKTPLGSITTIITRLVDGDYVETSTNKKSGKTLYKWKEPEYLTEEDIEDYPESMIGPPSPRRRPRKKEKNQPLLTEGSTAVN